MTANIHPDTGVAYGYVSANNLDQELVSDLMHNHGTNLSENEAWDDFVAEKKAEWDEIGGDEEFDESELDAQQFWDSIQIDEPIIEGEFEGVKYRTSYMGSDLHFWIFFSPVIIYNGGNTSPCLPNAGLPDKIGNVTCYSVPADWWSEYHLEQMMVASDLDTLYESEEDLFYWFKRRLGDQGPLQGKYVELRHAMKAALVEEGVIGDIIHEPKKEDFE